MCISDVRGRDWKYDCLFVYIVMVTSFQAAELVSKNISQYSKHMEDVRDHLEALLQVSVEGDVC